MTTEVKDEKKQVEQELLREIENLKKAREGIPADLESGLKKFSGAQEKRLADLEARLKNLDEDMEKKVKAGEEARKAIELKLAERKFGSDPADALGKKEVKQFNFAKFFNAIRTKDWKGAEFEHEIVTKAMGSNVASAGGYFVPPEYVTDIADRITAQAVVRKQNPTIVPMSTDTVLIPKITGGGTGYWIGQNTAITASDAKAGQAKLEANTLAVLVKLSNQLIQDSNPKVDELVRRDTAKVVALSEDLAFIEGNGVDKPLGIINYPVGTDLYTQIRELTNGANGASYAASGAFDKIYDQLYEIENNNGVASGWVMHPRTKNSLRKVKDSQNNYIYNVSPSVKEPDSLVGLPVSLTTQIPVNLTVGSSTDCSYILCSQWSEFLIGDKGGMEFALDSSGTAFEAYQTWIRVILRVGSVLRTPGVFCKATGVRP